VQASSNSNSDQLATSNQQTATAAAVSVVVQTHNRKICSGMLQYFSPVASNLRVNYSKRCITNDFSGDHNDQSL